MYWINSRFRITKRSDIEFLARLYEGVTGEITSPFTLSFGQEPFTRLLHGMLPRENDQGRFDHPFTIVARLNGPQTALAACPKLKKLDVATWNHRNKARLMEYVSLMDRMISFQMESKNDLGYAPDFPKNKLHSLHDLIRAAQLSVWATHIFIGRTGVLVGNMQCAYLSWIPLDHEHQVHDAPSLQFDKDDGFADYWSRNMSELEYMNTQFNKWKRQHFRGSFADFLRPYHEFLECSVKPKRRSPSNHNVDKPTSAKRRKVHNHSKKGKQPVKTRKQATTTKTQSKKPNQKKNEKKSTKKQTSKKRKR